MSLRHRGYLQEGSDVVDTILAQMGGARKLKAMIGAKNFMNRGGNTLSFDFMSAKHNTRSKTPNFVMITLTDRDDYDIEFARKAKRGLEYKVLKKYTGVYADQLKKVFEKFTGLRLSL